MPDSKPTPREAAIAIIRTLKEAGHTAYLAGGCVRDALLGTRPKDYDVATDAPPHVVRRLFEHTVAVGEAFGVMLVYIPDHKPGRQAIEVATFRAEDSYSDGRRPDRVVFTDAKEDAKRRDFTINGLFAAPTLHDDGSDDPKEDEVIDFVDGRADLAAGILRAIGDPQARFAEDYLRMLRAVRFASRLGFTIEPNTKAAIKQNAPKLAGIARERIGDEVRRMMLGPDAALAAKLLYDLGLSDVIFEHETQASFEPNRLTALSDIADYPTRLAAWLSDLGCYNSDQEIERFLGKLRLSNTEHELALKTLHLWQEMQDHWLDAAIAQRKRVAANPRYDQARLLVAVENEGLSRRIEKDVTELAADGIGLAPLPLVMGDDLITLGLRPGPRFTPLLDAVYDAQLDGTVGDKESALVWVKSYAAKMI